MNQHVPQTRFAEERYVDCGAEIAGLAMQHVAEVKPHLGMFPYAPAFSVYQALDAVDALYIATVRVGGELVGYLGAVIMPQHLHHSIKWASGDGVFLRRDYRGPRLADRLLAFAEDGLRARGVVLNTVGVAPDQPAFGRLLESRDYYLSGLSWSRRL